METRRTFLFALIVFLAVASVAPAQSTDDASSDSSAPQTVGAQIKDQVTTTAIAKTSPTNVSKDLAKGAVAATIVDTMVEGKTLDQSFTETRAQYTSPEFLIGQVGGSRLAAIAASAIPVPGLGSLGGQIVTKIPMAVASGAGGAMGSGAVAEARTEGKVDAVKVARSIDWLSVVCSAAGSTAGSTLGGAVAGPVGAFVGGMIGSLIGQKVASLIQSRREREKTVAVLSAQTDRLKEQLRLDPASGRPAAAGESQGPVAQNPLAALARLD